MKKTSLFLEKYDRDYFEKGARGGYKNYGKGFFFWFTSTLWTLLIKFLLHPKTILDVGTASGEFLSRFRAFGIEAHGIDMSTYAVSLASPEIRKFIQQGSITALPYKTDSFDVVCSFDLLEHIPNNQISQALRESQRVSRRYMFHKINTGLMEWKNPSPSHVSLHPIRWWLRKYHNLNIKIKLFFFIPFSWIIISEK